MKWFKPRWTARWICTVCGLDESRQFYSEHMALAWARRQHCEHLMSGLHIRISEIKL